MTAHGNWHGSNNTCYPGYIVFFLEDISMLIFQTLEQHLCTRLSVKIVIWILVLLVCLEVKTVYRVGFVRLGLDNFIMLCMSKNATIY